MAPRRQYNALLVLFGISEFPVIFLSLYTSPAFLLLGFLLVLIFGTLAMLVRCPACENPVGYLRKPAALLGVWVLVAPDGCRKCGRDLTKISD